MLDHAKAVTVVWLLLIAGLGAFAPQVEHNLSGAGWQAEGSESVAARELAREHFGGAASSAIQVVVRSEDRPVTKGEGAQVVTANAVGGCRMAASPELGVVDEHGSVYGYEGLYCIDGSIIPTSLGVNPSLTISAVSERCAERLVARGSDFGLPQRPASLLPGDPPEDVGDRVMPHAAPAV